MSAFYYNHTFFFFCIEFIRTKLQNKKNYISNLIMFYLCIHHTRIAYSNFDRLLLISLFDRVMRLGL